MALAGKDDLIMVYTDPPRDIITLSGAQRVQPEPGISGHEILVVNVSDEELHFEYNDLFTAPDIGATCWEWGLSPGESVLMDTLYSEGIPNRSLNIYVQEKNTWISVAECEISYDGRPLQQL